MDKDVRSKLKKLSGQYLQAEARISLLRPSKLLSTKKQRATHAQVASVLGELREARKPTATALVRLAYVRAMREIAPGATMSPEQELEVEALGRQLSDKLGYQESQVLLGFRRHLKRLRLADQMDELGYPPQTTAIMQRGAEPFPLEQRARESALSMVRVASAAGALAATGYDEGRDAA